jgi:long-chain acyl-CoA synthetase
MTILDDFQERVNERPDAAAFITGPRRISYADLFRSIQRVVVWLTNSHVRAGDRVIFFVRSGSESVPIIYLGILWLGALAVPVDASISAKELKNITILVEPKVVLGAPEIDLLHKYFFDPNISPTIVPATPQAADFCEILFSSGTTGTPKGVMLTHANVAAAAHMINGVLGNGPDDREVITVPMTHSFGLGRLRCILVSGGSAVLVPGLRFPGLVLKAMEEHKASGLSCVPAGLAILQATAHGEFSRYAKHLNYIELGSVPMSAEAKRAVSDSLPGTRIFMHYGLTEASRSTFLGFTRDRDYLASVGRPNPGVEVDVRGDDGGPLPAGIVGTVFIRGKTVTSSYWKNDELNHDRIAPDGWLNTHDLGWLDLDGYLHLAGRVDDQINVGGEKVMPEMVERAAEAHILVREAACVGIPDQLLGQVPFLFVVLDGTEVPDDLVITVSKQVPAFAVPRHIRIIDALPRTSSGKLQRAKLRSAASVQDAG